MKLIPKDIDIRSLLKGLLSTSFGKESRRLAHVRDHVRKKLGERHFKDKYRMKDLQYYLKLGEFFECGKRGVVEVDKDGLKRYLPYFCNMAKVCFECFNRYKRRIRWDNEARILAVAMANKVDAIATPVYTLHPEIRDGIAKGLTPATHEILNEINRLVVDSFKQAIGVGGHRGRSITGIVSVMHPFGSRNPFKDFLHFHLVWIPLKITEDGRLEKMSYWVDANKARAIWQKAQERFALKHGITLAGSETNIKLRYIFLEHKARVKHKLRYIFRSLLDNIFLSVRYFTDDLEEFVWLEDMGSDWLPHLDTWDVFERALEQYMRYPVKMVKSYGFLRNLKKYSKVLGIKQIEDKQVFVPVKTIRCSFRRIARRYYSKSLNKWVFKLTLQAKYGRLDWHNVPIEDVIGETCSHKTKNRWARAP